MKTSLLILVVPTVGEDPKIYYSALVVGELLLCTILTEIRDWKDGISHTNHLVSL